MLLVEDEPVFNSEIYAMHILTVGEQSHWVKFKIADWILKQTRKINDTLT